MSERGIARPRRSVLAGAAALCAAGWVPWRWAQAGTQDRRFHEAALAMRERALSWGDQPYGAVLVLDGKVIGEGPSRVVLHGDPNAHAEREAIRDAQRKLGRSLLAGSVLYSTSRPCPACEAAAAQAHVTRMVHGPDGVDAGAPRRGY